MGEVCCLFICGSLPCHTWARCGLFLDLLLGYYSLIIYLVLFSAYLDIDCWGGYTLACLFPNFLVIYFKKNLSFISTYISFNGWFVRVSCFQKLSFLDLSLSKMLTVFQLKLCLVLSSNSEIKEFSCLLIAKWCTIFFLPVCGCYKPYSVCCRWLLLFLLWVGVFGFVLGVLNGFRWAECYNDVKKLLESVRCLWKVEVQDSYPFHKLWLLCYDQLHG